jgi:hypothetical protein
MSNVRLSVDFETGRGFGAMATGLPAEYLSGDRVTVLSTIAALYLHPDPARANEWSQAVAMLALYGAGARVKLTPEQYLQLDSVAEEYEAIMRGRTQPGHADNENLVNAVRRYAEQRFAHDTRGGTAGLIPVNFQGWGNEGLIGSPEDLSFFNPLPGVTAASVAEEMPVLAPHLGDREPRRLSPDERRAELLTVAFLCTNPDPGRADPLAQAVSFLAVYTAGAEIDLTYDQYQQLCEQADEYDYTGTDMTQVAGFVRHHAVESWYSGPIA